MVYLTTKIDLTENGHPLADMDFTRDRKGRWNAHWQRAPLKPPKAKPAITCGFFDPGSRTGNTAYFPSVNNDASGQVVEYMAGDGGSTKLFQLCLKMDALVSKSRVLNPPLKKGQKKDERNMLSPNAVSYTHLTLPTNREV